MKKKRISTERYRKNTIALRDLVIIFIISLFTFILAAHFEVFELIAELSRKYEKWEIDEIVVLFIILAFAISIFSIRRWRELKHEITIRERIEEKLKLSEKKYREAYNQINFYKDLFTHDVSNILSSINLSSELCSKVINDPEKSDEVKEYMHIIKKQIGLGTKLIRNIQKLSEIENTLPQIQSIELQKVLNEAIEFLHKSFLDRNIEINISPSHKKFFVYANELLFDVFGNILNNAVKYNDSPLVDISVKISNAQKENIDYLKIEFWDNGIGISNTRKEFIFKKGYKEHKGSKGMGFGLSLVKKIIDSYNGQIWVEDRVKGDYTKGSNFILLIPGNNTEN